MGARERCTGDGMSKRFGLRFRRRGSGEGGGGFAGGRGAGQEVDLLGDGAAKVVERFADVGRIVVGFVPVLRTRE